MSWVSPTSWQFYVGTFVSNEVAGMADTRDLETLRRATTDACTPGPSFDPARCSYMAQTLGRVQTQYNCTTGNVQSPAMMRPSAPQSWSSASAVLPSQGQILAVKSAADQAIGTAAIGALSGQLSNKVCTA